ncbi:glutathione S-transferase, partial [Tremellales sp. Uapishka_1]
MLELHGHPLSTCTRRVLTVLLELGLVDGKDFEVVTEDFANIKSEEYLAHQPFGQMPWLKDTATGFELFESRAISKYVAAKYSSPLLPLASDLKAYGSFETAASTEAFNFDLHAAQIARQLVFGPRRGVKTDDARVAAESEALAGRLDAYETILSKHKYLAGNELTLADLFHLPYGKMAQELGHFKALTDGAHPNVARWWNEISSLPSWAAANAYIKQ